MPIFKRDNIIDVSSSVDALRVTQRGDGNSILIEDTTNPDSSPFIIKNNGRVGIGTLDPVYNLQVGDSSVAGFKIGIASTGSAAFSEINFGRSSSLSTDPADVYRGVIGYSHLTESLYFSQNGIRAITISGSQNVGIGTTTPTAKLHVATGNIMVDDGYGIIFGNSYSGPTGSSVSLNDYEFGSWTPTLSGSTTAGVFSGTITGSYVKIGKQVFISGHMQISSTGSAAGNLSIANLPYTSLSYGLSEGSRAVAHIAMMPNSFQPITTKPVIYGSISNNSSKMNLYYYYNGSQNSLQVTDTNSNFNLYFSGVYPTNS